MPRCHAVYLHGFASSPASGKAQFLAGRLAQHGMLLHRPDLNGPDFSTLTTTRMIDQVVKHIKLLPQAPVVLIGSSLGAFVALHLADRLMASESVAHPIAKLVFLAPALDFGRAGVQELGEKGLEQWRRNGWVEMMHYALGEPRRIHYEFYSDAGRYDSESSRVQLPILVIQGRYDDVVNPMVVKEFVATRPHVNLVMVDDDHQLGKSFDRIWTEIASFLDLDDTP
mgnify:CR=1 FL=1